MVAKEKPYLLLVAELIYSKVCEIKNENSDFLLRCLIQDILPNKVNFVLKSYEDSFKPIVNSTLFELM